MNKDKPASQVRYNADIAARVCERIATTPQSMSEICEYPDMPGIMTSRRTRSGAALAMRVRAVGPSIAVMTS